eukprot:TRINITY_DN13711_c0_g2_i1.p1 TRINITY_DN13711_c0_g2~~TRINITY_DN13711_c0_g2_i1.p1  ORF type:complete len:632 (-),score=96.36 TRINITY_DN13711_c0_g2_i1:45-1808(-)
MIEYNSGYFGLAFAWQFEGSVFPRACMWALPTALLAACFQSLLNTTEDDPEWIHGVSTVWSGFSFSLGFLVVFRSNQAYARFWEGATLLNQMRGTWFHAIASLVCFLSADEDKALDTALYRQFCVRLASMLHCCALQQVCELSDDFLEIFSTDGIEQESLRFLLRSNDRVEVLINWIHRLILDGQTANLIVAASPVLTRVFQELSDGIVHLNDVKKIRQIPFPFPYAQMIACMLVVHTFMTVMLASFTLKNSALAGVTTFSVNASFWALYYIASEIDQPFGDDSNDLPIDEIQQDFNISLLQLLDPLGVRVPSFRLTPDMAFQKDIWRFGLTTSAMDSDSLADLQRDSKSSVGTKGRLSTVELCKREVNKIGGKARRKFATQVFRRTTIQSQSGAQGTSGDRQDVAVYLFHSCRPPTVESSPQPLPKKTNDRGGGGGGGGGGDTTDAVDISSVQLTEKHAGIRVSTTTSASERNREIMEPYVIGEHSRSPSWKASLHGALQEALDTDLCIRKKTPDIPRPPNITAVVAEAKGDKPTQEILPQDIEEVDKQTGGELLHDLDAVVSDERSIQAPSIRGSRTCQRDMLRI